MAVLVNKRAFKNYLKLVVFLVPLFLSACTACSFFSKKTGQVIPDTGKGFSLKDALTLGKSVQCTYTTEEGEVKTWVKGNKVRVEGVGFAPQEAKNGQGGMINDGEWIYIWGGEEKTGIKYKLSAMEQQDWAKDVQELKDPQQWAAGVEEKYKISCNETMVADNLFSPPSDIEFQDMSEMFEKVGELDKSFQEGEQLDEEKIKELEELMKSFEE
jgi:hypothetical protein